MKVIDVSGPIRNGMWSFGSLFPQPHIEEKSGFCEGFGEYFYTEIKGMHSQVGTYIETPAHFFGFANSFLVEDIPLDKLCDVPCSIFKLDKDVSDPQRKHAITKEDLLACPAAQTVQAGDCIAVATGWDAWWMDDAHYYDGSPYFTAEAMQWIIARKPSILASDTPSWENLQHPQGFFPDFYRANILMLAPLYNLQATQKSRALLTALPLKIDGVAASPCRVIIKED